MRPGPADAKRVALGVDEIDRTLEGGLERGVLHEFYAAGIQDLPSAIGFAAGIAALAAGRRPILWIRQEFLETEAGALHAPGLAELGLDPSAIILVRARDLTAVLRAGREAARCGGLGAALIEPWSATPDLTASRRLSLAAEASGVTLLMVAAGSPLPSAAHTRWQVRPSRSRPLEASAPGAPAFFASLLRHRGGVSGQEWRLEWDRDRKCFNDRSVRLETPLSRPVVSVPSARPVAAGDAGGLRKVG